VQVSSDAVWRGWHVRLCRTRENECSGHNKPERNDRYADPAGTEPYRTRHAASHCGTEEKRPGYKPFTRLRISGASVLTV